MYVIWAYAVDDIRTSSHFVQHSHQGWSNETFVLVPEAPIPTEAKSASLHSSIYGIVSITIALSFVNVLLM